MQAAAGYANEEALAYFNRALELTPETKRRARFDTLLKRERVFDLLGKRSQQRQDLKELAYLADHFDEATFLRARIATDRHNWKSTCSDHAAAKASARGSIQQMEREPPGRPRAAELLVDAHLLETWACSYPANCRGQGAAGYRIVVGPRTRLYSRRIQRAGAIRHVELVSQATTLQPLTYWSRR